MPDAGPSYDWKTDASSSADPLNSRPVGVPRTSSDSRAWQEPSPVAVLRLGSNPLVRGTRAANPGCPRQQPNDRLDPVVPDEGEEGEERACGGNAGLEPVARS